MKYLLEQPQLYQSVLVLFGACILIGLPPYFGGSFSYFVYIFVACILIGDLLYAELITSSHQRCTVLWFVW
jgi:uncharacterized membrane protein YjjP (DUF1212 family)